MAACWSPATPQDRDGAAEDRRLGRAVVGIAVAHLGQDRARHVEQRAADRRRRRPWRCRRAACARRWWRRWRARVPPVSRHSRKLSTVPKARWPASAERARALHVVEQPGDLGGREVGVEQQPGLGRDHRLVPGPLQVAARLRRAPVLPDDGAMDGLARAPVPDDAGLALVGDADGGDVAGPELGGGERLPGRLHRRAPDVLRVVLHPARGRIVLGELALRRAPGWPDPAPNTMARLEVVP